MIIVKIHSGLGNQMFQYAFARTLQIKFNAKVLIDTRTDFLINSNYREYGLDKFNIQLHEANRFQLSKFLSLREQGVKLNDYKGLRRQFIRFWRKALSDNLYVHYRNLFHRNILSTNDESKISYLLNIINSSEDYYISGYFHNNEFVDDILPTLRFEFTLKSDYLFDSELAHELKKENTVSIHVRRGDYLYLSNLFPVLGMDYFTKAISIIKTKVESPSFFIFSDDKDWVKDNFKLGENCYLVNEKYSYNMCDDLLLMSMCKHHIISNSTYSWWGAKLNANEDKIVIAPSLWYSDSDMNLLANQMIPKQWTRI